MIITTYNRGQLLESNLYRLAGLTVPDKIIVVDDGGRDDTNSIVYWAYKKFGLPMHYVYNNNPGWSNRTLATNIGIKLADTDEIISCDAELWFETDVVAQLMEARRDHPNCVLCPETMRLEPYEGAHIDAYTTAPGGYVSLYKREWLIEIGGWDEDLPAAAGYDDCDLHTRLAMRGHPQVKVSGVSFQHRWHPGFLFTENELTADGRNPNLAYLESKTYPRDIVANRGREWGVLR